MLNDDGVILQSSDILLTVWVLCQRYISLHYWWVFSSYNTVACCFETGVIYDCPTWSASRLLCVLCHSKSAFHYSVCFVI